MDELNGKGILLEKFLTILTILTIFLRKKSALDNCPLGKINFITIFDCKCNGNGIDVWDNRALVENNRLLSM
jgi:hypothetical protein